VIGFFLVGAALVTTFYNWVHVYILSFGDISAWRAGVGVVY